MRILHLGKFYPPCPGGIERFSADLIGALAQRGLQQAALVHATPGQARAQRDWIEHGAVQLREVPCHGRLLFAPLSPRWPLDCRRLIGDFKPDLLHIHAPNPSAFWLLGMAAAKRIPWLVQWHADVPDDAQHRGIRLAYPLYRQLERRLLQRAARIVPSTDSYRDASSALQPFLDRCAVIPLGMGAASGFGDGGSTSATPVAWPSRGLKLLAVGRLSYYKGFAVLLEALARLPQVSLLLIGDGEQGSDLQRAANRLQLGERVRLAGKVSDAELHAAYRDCDAFCLPSLDRSEAFGLVLLEAMREGKPCVISAVPGSGMGEVVVDDISGLHVAPNNVDALTAAIARLAADVDLRQRLGAAGHARFVAHYALEQVSARWAALYRDVLGFPSPSGEGGA